MTATRRFRDTTTAFVTLDGVFRYTRMPFGLKIMTTIFPGIPGVVVFLDDIVVFVAGFCLFAEGLSQLLM